MAGRSVSERLAGLKFMQRAKARRDAEQKVEEEQKVVDASQWVLPARGTSATQCVVIVEGDPKPGAASGRMSFGSFNPAVEKLMEETAALQSRRGGASTAGRGDAAVSDAEMAERFQVMLARGEDGNGVLPTKRPSPPEVAEERERTSKKRRDGGPSDNGNFRPPGNDAGRTNGAASAAAGAKVEKAAEAVEGGAEVLRKGGWRERALGRGSGGGRR